MSPFVRRGDIIIKILFFIVTKTLKKPKKKHFYNIQHNRHEQFIMFQPLNKQVNYNEHLIMKLIELPWQGGHDLQM